jgi:hypothetical protein
MILKVIITLVSLIGPDGQHIEVNPAEVANIREPRGQDHFDSGIKCVIYMSNGNFIGVIEDCVTVRGKLEGGKR